MAIDKVVIQGAEFTRVENRYLLQTEVERALARTAPVQVPHFERLTTLLEDIVSTADAVALEVAELSPVSGPGHRWNIDRRHDNSAEAMNVLRQVREELHGQIVIINSFLNRVDG